MKMFKVWQPGWEEETKTIEVEDDECPSCMMGAPPPYMEGGQYIVAAFQSVNLNTVEYRHMTCFVVPYINIRGWQCREATQEEVAEALKEAEDIKTGKETDAKATYDLSQAVKEKLG